MNNQIDKTSYHQKTTTFEARRASGAEETLNNVYSEISLKYVSQGTHHVQSYPHVDQDLGHESELSDH